MSSHEIFGFVLCSVCGFMAAASILVTFSLAMREAAKMDDVRVLIHILRSMVVVGDSVALGIGSLSLPNLLGVTV